MATNYNHITSEEALSLFIDAVNNVDKRFYKVTESSNIPAEIERVFCYELYHQFRIRLTDAVASDEGEVLDFHGELRKNNATALAGKVPDLLLHHSGHDNANLLCVEVKTGSGLNKCDIHNDIDKLYKLCKEHNYKNAVYLLVSTDEKSIARVKTKITELTSLEYDQKIINRMVVLQKCKCISARKSSFKEFIKEDE